MIGDLNLSGVLTQNGAMGATKNYVDSAVAILMAEMKKLAKP